MATTTKKRRKRRGRKKSISPVIPILLALLVLILILVGAGIRRLLMWQPEEIAVAEETPTPAPTLPPSLLAREGFGQEDGYITYQDEQLTARLGIDVSAHQGWIDWAAVAESPVEFVILRAGYRGYGDGAAHQDEYFTYNIESALESGLDVGIYYFSQAVNEAEAVTEAEHVLRLIEDYNVTMPIYYDWEAVHSDTARTDTMSATEITDCALAFCRTIESAGYRAGVYFNLDLAMYYYHLYDLRNYEFWLAEYGSSPSFPFSFGMWQYAEDGTVPGIEEPVDMDLFFFRNK